MWDSSLPHRKTRVQRDGRVQEWYDQAISPVLDSMKHLAFLGRLRTPGVRNARLVRNACLATVPLP